MKANKFNIGEYKSLPKPMGSYRLGKDKNGSTIYFYLTHHPSKMHRFFMRVCLGFYYESL